MRQELIASFGVDGGKSIITATAGFIKEITPEELVIQDISEYGVPDGECVLKRSVISRISIESDYENVLTLLYKNK